MNEQTLYDVWWQHPEEGDQGMEEDHIPHWKRVLGFIPEDNLEQCSVLDFGCNQGGFLRLLYKLRPFREGVGTDLARQSIDIAHQRRGDLPLEFHATGQPEQFVHRFDLAFSLAVLYLIPDLNKHALQIRTCLKPGGIYYATFADYGSNPSLPEIRDRINGNAAIPMQDHTLDTISEAFMLAGFQVSVRRMPPTGFVDLSHGKKWYNRVPDQLQFAYEQSYIFRFVAPKVNKDILYE
ncbi:SAM-dependent methyltransferase [Paenibacillus sp. JGP012]|uniref:class I SAM-dependent methyltransferase n=1 Tax=Paenibacillus sp. JGP012 TaxID=2735914 RepID=UPI0016185CF9|nr:class I SAM-dependent methyltransferase [Paenibacillus sp. JGP012]MBB6021873.1 SAM-dependent methyltransferase [Paenibacillus sp. JGP012]